MYSSPRRLERGGERRLGDVPLLVGADPVLGPRRELDLDLEPELVVDRVAEVEAAGDLVLDLLGGAEDVRVVLREHPHAQEPVEGAGQLVAVQDAGLGHPQRQLAVAVGAVGVERAVARAVHRLQPELAVLGLEREHVLAVLLPVARGDPQLLVVDLRRAHLDVAALAVLAAAQILEHVPDHHPLRVPERRARRDVGEVEQVELRPEPAVVALPRLLEPLEMRVEVALLEERGAVDPGQLRVLLVAAPVGAGEAGQLERLDRRGVLQMRAAAEIGEVALGVKRDLALGGLDELDLVRLALGLEARPRLVARDLLASPDSALLDLALDLGLDRLEVALADRLRELEVVVEAVLDRRADRDLHAGIEPPDRLGEQVRARMAQHVERVRIGAVARRQELDRLAVRERKADVLDGPVRAHEHGLLGELRPDRARGVEAGRAVRELELLAVGEDHLHRSKDTAGLRASRRPRSPLCGRPRRPRAPSAR